MESLFKRKLGLFFVIFPFLNPNALQYIPATRIVYEGIQIWKLLVILLLVISYFLRNKHSIPVLLVTVLEMIFVLASVVNGVFDSKVFTNALLIIGVAIMTEFAIEVDKDLFMKVFTNTLLVLSIINLVSCIVYPAGLPMAKLYTNAQNPLYFLGIDNGQLKALLPLFSFTYLLRINPDANKSRIEIILINLVGIVTFLRVGSATGVVVYTIFTIIVLLYEVVLRMKIPVKLMGLIYLAFFIGVVVLGSNSVITSSINRLLGRSGTFTGRMLLWTRAIQLILQKPILGYGYTSGNISIWNGLFSSHNLFLEILIQGGMLALIVFIVLVLYSFSRLKYARVDQYNIIGITIFSYLLIGLMETGISSALIIFIILGCYSSAEYRPLVFTFR